MKKNKKPMTKAEILAEEKAVRKQINALKKALNKLKVKATPIAVRAWKLGEELEQSGKYDTKQTWISKIINDCSFWQDADHEIKLLIKSF